jgi:C-terminal processing protease CtpA/Prc
MFDPEILDRPDFKAMDERIRDIAATPSTREEFVRAFNAAWRAGPISHVSLQIARSTADETATYLDTMRVGGRGARLEWRGAVAVLTVTTMMGLDTIEQIEQAFADIRARGAAAVVIDLRENDGGAFAGIALVQPVLTAPVDAGAFVSQGWNREMNRPPTIEDVSNIEPWTGWSLKTFWRDVQDNRITRIQFRPAGDTYSGQVFVLVSRGTRSAAGMTADALKASGRATVVGEKTAGRMLSQKMYDLSSGLQLSLPIADYYSFTSGRIEGHGVAPHIVTAPELALDTALRLAAR